VKLVFAYCLLALFTILGSAAVFACLTKDRTKGPVAKVQSPEAPVVKSFRSAYPFDGEAKVDEGMRMESDCSDWRCRVSGAALAYQNEFRRLTIGVGNYTMGVNTFCRFFQGIAWKYDERVGNRVARYGNSPVIRLDNGSYTQLFPYRDASGTWTNVLEFAAWLQTQNIRCVHLLSPYKFDDRETAFPEGIPHGYGQMVAEYRRFMAAHQLPCYDAKEFLMAANPDFHSWFCKAYLHYTAHAGLTIAREVARKLGGELGIAADWEALKEDGFTRCVYPALSREGWGNWRDDSAEDVVLHYPRQDGRFHIEIPSKGMDRTGGFHDTLVAQPCLETSDMCRYAFLHGYPALVRVENLTCANRTRVLVLRRCDARVMCPYLACAVRYLDVISPPDFDGSIRKFIEETRPDVVMFCTYMQTSEGDSFWKLP